MFGRGGTGGPCWRVVGAPRRDRRSRGRRVICCGRAEPKLCERVPMTWEMVDEGWGRKAVDFSTVAELSSCREYVFMHSRLGLGPNDRVLDVACGSGLAVELARMRGARCDGIDASQRLVAIARFRSPDSDIRVGDMHALPWADATYDVVTSFRGVWGTTQGAMQEVRRVLRPSGRLAMTVWGDVGKSPGA